jgi:hypothetical protein
LCKIGGVGEFSVQVPGKKIMSQGGKNGCAKLTAFFLVWEQTNLRIENR